MTTVTTWAVLLRERDSDDYTLEATYRGLVCPTPEGGPYLAQEGDVFLVERIDGRTIYGRLANAYELLGRESDAAGSEDIAEHWPSPPRTRRPATDRRAHLPWTSLTVSSRAAR